jgi:hypothetical protein
MELVLRPHRNPGRELVEEFACKIEASQAKRRRDIRICDPLGTPKRAPNGATGRLRALFTVTMTSTRFSWERQL